MSIIKQIGDSHPNVLTYGIDSHGPESASHFAMRITLFSLLLSTLLLLLGATTTTTTTTIENRIE